MATCVEKWRSYWDFGTIWHWKSGPSANTVSSLCCKISANDAVDQDVDGRVGHWKVVPGLFLTLRLNDRGIIQRSCIGNFSLLFCYHIAVVSVGSTGGNVRREMEGLLGLWTHLALKIRIQC